MILVELQVVLDHWYYISKVWKIYCDDHSSLSSKVFVRGRLRLPTWFCSSKFIACVIRLSIGDLAMGRRKSERSE